MMIAEDKGLRPTATTAGMQARRIDDLDLPDSARQHDLPYEDPPTKSKG